MLRSKIKDSCCQFIILGHCPKISYVSHIQQNKPAYFLGSNLNLRSRLSTSTEGGRIRAWQSEGFDGTEGVRISPVRVPIISKPSDVLIKVSAASVNPIDTAVLEGYGKNIFSTWRGINQLQVGTCNSNTIHPITVGRDFVGEIARVGHGVKNLKVRDKVWGIVLPQRPGSHSEYVITESWNVCPKPVSLSDVEAASIPYVGLTSWSTAVFTGGLTPEECFGAQVLVLGASGGLGTFLTQLLSAWGAQVTGVCSEDAFELVLSCGVSEVFDYRDPETRNRLTSQPRFDLIVDASGANDVRWAEGLKEWQNASYVTLFSPLLKNTDKDGLILGFAKSAATLLQQNVETLSRGRFCKWAYFKPDSDALEAITRLVSQGKIRPVVEKVYSFDDAKSAYEHVLGGHLRGKVVIDFNS